MSEKLVGMTATHRMYVSRADSRFSSDLIHAGHIVTLFCDVASELCVRIDNDEGLIASLSDSKFHTPVRVGDIIEITAELTRVGKRSREMAFVVNVVAREVPEKGKAFAEILSEPIVAATGKGTLVVGGSY